MSTLNPEIKRLMDCLENDAGFRYHYSLNPDECLKMFNLSDAEKRLLRTRDQDDWFTYLYGGGYKMQKQLCVTFKVVTMNMNVKLARIVKEEIARGKTPHKLTPR